MSDLTLVNLDSVTARVGYVTDPRSGARYRIYPPASGQEPEAPAMTMINVPIHDARSIADHLNIDEIGFELSRSRSDITDYMDTAAVRQFYYPGVAELLRARTGAEHVIVFDHNVRSALAAEAGQTGVRAPVQDVHNDYTEQSGRKRVASLLRESGCEHFLGRRCALINVWRPIRGPVKDRPLALCDVRSVSEDDFVEIDIDHFDEENPLTPSYTGQIYSLSYSPKHRWYYMSDMMPDEVLIFKCYDSLDSGVSRFTPHTGFSNPDCPAIFTPRESIEARALVIYSS